MENIWISKLILAKNKLGDDGVVLIGKALSLQKHVIEVDLSNNQLTYRGVAGFFKAIKDN